MNCSEFSLQQSVRCVRAYQRFLRYCVVLYEKGVQVHGSVIQEFWEAHESRGEDFGDESFV